MARKRKRSRSDEAGVLTAESGEAESLIPESEEVPLPETEHEPAGDGRFSVDGIRALQVIALVIIAAELVWLVL
jgi:hypothetical protein